MDTTQDTRMSLTSQNIVMERIEALRELFPEVFSEGTIDFTKLKQAVGEFTSNSPERYGLSWAGKSEAIRAVQSLSSGTLVPCKEESVNFDATENLIIEGDNLEVLKLLQKSYYGKIKAIYIDPPYNTGNKFIYPDNYREGLDGYLRYSGQRGDDGSRLETEMDTSGRFHSKWLSMMYPRLFLARNLLTDDGFICVSIGDEEMPNLRLLMNDVFGEENHRNTIAVRRYDKNLSRQFLDRGLTSLAIGFEYVLVYSRTNQSTMNPVFREASEERQANGYWKGFWNAPDRPTMRYELLGVRPKTGQWKWKEEIALEAVSNYETYLRDFAAAMTLEEYWEQTGKKLKFIRRNRDGKGMNLGVEHWIPPSEGILRTSNWSDMLASESISGLGLEFDNPKNTNLIKELIRLACDDGGFVLDFFAGSGTTAQAVMELNEEDAGTRRFILVQLPEPTPVESAARNAGFDTIADICRERVRRTSEKMISGKRGRLKLDDSDNQDYGFKAFKLAASNFKLWNADEAPKDADALAEQLRLYADHIVDGRSQEDILYELLLKAGLPLSANIEEKEVNGQRVFSVADGLLLICLEDEIDQETLRGMIKLKPEMVLCLDAAFKGNDQLKANIVLEMESHEIKFHTV